MSRLSLLIIQLFIYSISINFGIEASASAKDLIITIPAPMSEFLKPEIRPLSNDSNSADCQINEKYLSESLNDYKNRIRNIKWSKKSQFCDSRFRISHIRADETKTPFHHMSVEASLENSPVQEWVSINTTKESYVAIFLSQPFSFETMGTEEHLGQLYARRIWKLALEIDPNRINKITINKTNDNAMIVDAVVSELTSPTRKIIGDSDYRDLGKKVQVESVANNAALTPAFAKLAGILNSFESTKENSKTNETQASLDEEPSALVLIALHKYFLEFQRIDFSKDDQAVKVLKSVNNGMKTVRLLRELRQITKQHPELLTSFSDQLFKKISSIFSVSSATTPHSNELNQLAGMMSTIPKILISDLDCQDLTNILLNVIKSQGQSLTEFTLEELLSKSMAALSPLITELAIDSVNNLMASVNFTINSQPVVAGEGQRYSSSELTHLFFEGIELSNKNEFQEVFVQINSIFARLKEFYLRAYQGILLFDKTKVNDERTPASVDNNDHIEQIINTNNCPVQKYKFTSRFFDTTDAEFEFKKTEQDSAISIPVTRVPLEHPLSMDLAKQEIEKQLTAAAQSLPMVMATGTGQLEQLLAVMSQQSLSIVDILRNTTFNGRSNFYFQIVLSPSGMYDLKNAMKGSRFPVPIEKFLPSNGDPLCDARNVVIALDYLFASDGTINFKLQWGLQLPRQFSQPFSEFTSQQQGIIVKNSPGKPDQVHISDFQLMPLKKEDISHFALFTLSANGQLGLKNISANIKFGPQMSLLFDRQFVESKALNFKNKENVFIETPSRSNLFNRYFKNSEYPALEMFWTIGSSRACTENETFGPLLNLSKAYPQPLQSIFNKVGLQNVFMHSGKARLDEVEVNLYIDPAQLDEENYSPSVKMNKFELQVFPYNLEANYYSEKDKFSIMKSLLKEIPPSGQRVIFNLGHSLCFPLPHNKEVQIMNGVTETLNKQMPDIWGRARKMLDQVRSIIGKPIKNPTSDVEHIDTDTYPDSQVGE